MNRIGIDARLIGQTGVGVYIRNLLFYLNQIDSKNQYLVFLDEADRALLPDLNSNFLVIKSNWKWHSWTEQIGFAWQLYANKLDLMHFTYFSYPILYFRKFVITIHDLIPLEQITGKASSKILIYYFFKILSASLVFFFGALFSKKIIFPTKYIKYQFQKRFPFIDKQKMNVTYEGVDYLLHQYQNIRINSPIKGSYILYLGNFYPHKNIDFLLKAMQDCKENVHLVLKGPADFFANKIKSKINHMNLDKRVSLLTHKLSTEEFVGLIQGANALVTATKGEGFGLTLVEARFFGVPVIANHLAVFDEILGKDGYLQLDIQNPTSLEQCLEKLQEKKVMTQLPPELSFAKMSQKTLDIYEQVLENSKQ